MDITPIYSRNNWNNLSENTAKEILLHLVETQLPGFTIKSFEQFNKFNQSTFTAVLDHNGSEFVFVPGDTIVLGLDKWAMADENKQKMAGLLEQSTSETDTFIRERLSPVRTVTVSPMIVERSIRETGYFAVAMDDERLVTDGYFEKALQELRNTPKEKYIYTVNNSFRLEKNGSNIKAFLYEPSSYDELTTEIATTGFRLPTEDEWEYLCGGGSRTLYPWGDNIDYSKKYHHFAADKDSDEPYFLDTPNHFGIIIANNPYHYEVMMDSEWFLKAGDGGCNICGGGGLDIGYLPASTYYRDINIFDEEMNFKDEITGDYTFVRRIKRLAPDGSIY
ncbi:SUMF1/EgtB/PvdO family nonheme iron enzyme [Chitinophaga ginsengisegetis]|nr:SUMF1/EgtB/PvdO family nonheme iron enzyme [Chitinophaga ginsengisegetis]